MAEEQTTPTRFSSARNLYRGAGTLARRFTEKASLLFSSYRGEVANGSNSSGIFGSHRFTSLNNLPMSRFRQTGDYLAAYSQIASVYTCTNQIANSIAGLPLTFTDAKGKVVATLGQEIARPGSFAYILENPNPEMDYYELIETTVAHLELTGNALWLLENVNGKGQPEMIWPLNPAYVTVVVDPEKGKLGYIYQLGGVRMPFDNADVLHFKYSNPQSYFWGQGTLAALTNAMDAEVNISDSIRGLYENGAVIPGAFVKETDMSAVQFERLKAQFKQDHTGVANWFTPLVLDGGVKWQNMTVGHTDLGTMDIRRYTKEEIYETFGVPMSEVGNQGRANVKNDHLTDNYWLNTISPKTRRLVGTLRKLAAAYDPNIGLTMPVPVKPAETEILDNAGKVDQMFFITIPEKRTIFKKLFGGIYGLEDMKEDLPIEEFPLAPQPQPPASGEMGNPANPDTPQLPPGGGVGAGVIKQPDANAPAETGFLTNVTDLTTSDAQAEAKSLEEDKAARTLAKADDHQQGGQAQAQGQGGQSSGRTGGGGPGSRGAPYWLDKNGKVRYGQKPMGPDARAARQSNRQRAKEDLLDPQTGKQFKNIEDILAKGWTTPYPDQMSEIEDKNQAIDTASAFAKINPDYMFLVVKSNGLYYVVAKGIRDLPKVEKKKPGPDNKVEIQTNVGASQKKKPAAKSATANHSGVMAALMLPEGEASALSEMLKDVAWPEGSETTQPDELHLTLAYLGDVPDLENEIDLGRLIKCLVSFCLGNRILTGSIAGAGRFNTLEQEGMQPIWAAFDCPGLAELRTGLISYLADSGFNAVLNHGFTPHITLGYVPKDARTPEINLEPLEITFDRITLCWGDDHYPCMFLGDDQDPLYEKALLTESEKAVLWNEFNDSAKEIEDKFQAALADLFKEQGQAALAELNNPSDRAKAFGFDFLDKFIERFKAIAEPFIKASIAKGYELAGVNAPSARGLAKQAKDRATRMAKEVAETTRQQVEAAIGKGQGQGRQGISQIFDNAQLVRSAVIATTEVPAAINHGRRAGYDELGYEKLTWISRRDNRVRPTHRAADGQKSLDGLFTVGGHSMRYPGDSNAPSSETVRCRCTVVPVPSGD